MRRQDPTSYGVDKAHVATWLTITGAPVLISLWGVPNGPPALWTPLYLLAVPATALLIFVSRFRVIYAADRFIYRHWGATIDVAYEDIAAIEVTNAAPNSKAAVGAFLVTRAGVLLPFWPKLFPPAAVKRFFELAPVRVRGQAPVAAYPEPR